MTARRFGHMGTWFIVVVSLATSVLALIRGDWDVAVSAAVAAAGWWMYATEHAEFRRTVLDHVALIYLLTRVNERRRAADHPASRDVPRNHRRIR